jgi:hypothetical protein
MRKTMKTALITVVVTLFSSAAIAANGNGNVCSVGRSSALFFNSHRPEAATKPEWRAQSKALQSIMTNCPTGPDDAASRQLFYEFADEYLSLDLGALAREWNRRGEPASEGTMESFTYERRDLRAYLTKIFDPTRDASAAPIILRQANGAAMARSGRAAKDDVVKAARTTSSQDADRHDTQSEAIRALGLWIHPSNKEFSDAEKSEFIEIIFAALPPGDNVPGGRMHALTRACLQALANARDENAKQRVIAWANAYAQKYDHTFELAKLALNTVNSIQRLLRAS